MGMSADGETRLHALVVGGTGMLRGLTLALAGDGYTVSVIARSEQRLLSLADAAGQSFGHIDSVSRINPLPVDYRDTAQLRKTVSAAIAKQGPIRLAVCWIHSVAPQALGVIAQLIGESSDSCRLFHVLGSAAANPAKAAARLPQWLPLYPNIRYRQVILGFVIEGGASRWLTHAEISDGVLAAVRRDAPFSVVGTVEPWSMRP